MKTCKLTLFVVLAVHLLSQRAWGLACAGIPGGSGDYYFIGRPILNVSYNPVSGKTYMTDDMGAGRLWEGDSSAITTIDSNGYPIDVVVIPAANMVYYTMSSSSVVKAYDLVQGRVVNSIPVGSSPHGLAYSAPTKRLYAANSLSNTVSVIDVNTASPTYQRVIKTISVGAWPWTLAVNETRGRIYVGNRNGKSLSVIREDQLIVMGSVYLGFRPGEMSACNSTNKVYIVSEESNVITVVNGNTDPGVIQTTFTSGSDPWGIVVNPNTHSVFVTDYVNQTVTWYRQDVPPDGTAYSILDTYSFGTPLRGIDVNQATDQFIVASEQGILFDGLPPCDRRYLDKCLDMRVQDMVDDAAVESFMESYFHQ